MYKYILFFFFFGLVTACNEPNPAATTQESTVEKTAKEKKKEIFEKTKNANSTSAETLANLEKLPSIELSVIENLWEKCTYVDYVYYELPISASLDNQNSIRSAITHISEDPAAKVPGCKPIGRVFYQVDGENTLQGDVFFTKGCTYFLWVDKGGQYYAGNLITDTGMKFFASNIKAALGKGKQ